MPAHPPRARITRRGSAGAARSSFRPPPPRTPAPRRRCSEPPRRANGGPIAPTADVPPHSGWKRDLAPYVAIDRRRAAGQIACVVAPCLAAWSLAAVVRPSAWGAVGLGLVATLFPVRAHSLGARIPNYPLWGPHASQPMFSTTPVVRVAGARPAR